MGKLAERLNMLEKDCLKTLMAFLPEGSFSSIGTFTGAANEEIVPGLDTKAVMNLAVNTLAFCEESAEALDKIEDLEDTLASVLEEQEKIRKCLTVMMGHNKAEFTELGNRFDSLEEAVRELADKRNNQPRKAEKEKKEE